MGRFSLRFLSLRPSFVCSFIRYSSLTEFASTPHFSYPSYLTLSFTFLLSTFVMWSWWRWLWLWLWYCWLLMLLRYRLFVLFEMFITLRHSSVEVDILIDARYTTKNKIRYVNPHPNKHYMLTHTQSHINYHECYVTACIFFFFLVSSVCALFLFVSCIGSWQQKNTTMHASTWMMSMFSPKVIEMNEKKIKRGEKKKMTAKRGSFPFFRQSAEFFFHTKHIHSVEDHLKRYI